MIAISGLCRSFGRVVALSDCDVQVEPGEIVAVLGGNGAGKSTLVKCATGVLVGNSGSVRVAGLDPWRDRAAAARRMGVLFGHRGSLWPDLTVRDGLVLTASMYGVTADAIDAWVERLGVTDRLHAPVRTLSLGERVRVDLVGALLHRPVALFLDEPTLGLDPAVRQVLRGVLREAVGAGAALLLTSHDLSEVAELADRVVVLKGGRVAARGTVAELRAQAGGGRTVTVTAPVPLGDLQVAQGRRLGSASFELAFEGPSGPVIAGLLARLPEGCDVVVNEARLEDVLAPHYAR